MTLFSAFFVSQYIPTAHESGLKIEEHRLYFPIHSGGQRVYLGGQSGHETPPMHSSYIQIQPAMEGKIQKKETLVHFRTSMNF